MSTVEGREHVGTGIPVQDGARLLDATEELAGRLFTAVLDTLEVASVHLGRQLGFYRALADHGDANAAELAARTGTAERYAREWLEQQATAGFLSLDDVSANATERRYGLPEAHRPVLVNADDPNFMAPLATLAVGVCTPMGALVDAYRSGAGVPYEDYGEAIVEGIAALNRPQFLTFMADWLGSVAPIHERLRAAPPAHVADVACGSAWSSIAIARAYPGVTVDALDVDATSIEHAGANVAAAALTDRVHPRVHDASAPSLGGPYDLVTIFEALHDMNHPVEALRAARRSLSLGGSVLVADEAVAERFGELGDEVERFNYGWSILHCLPVGNVDDDSAATGAVMRPDDVRAYADEAGFGRVDVLPIEHDFWRFYRLAP